MTQNAKAGCDALVYVNTGTVQTPVWTAVGAQEDATLNRSTATIDTTSKDGSGWESKMAGFKTWSIDFDNFYTTSDAGYLALEAAFEARATMMIQALYPDGTAYTGAAMITSAPVKLAIKDAIKVSFKMDGAGPLTNNLQGTVTTPSLTTPANNATNVVLTADFVGSAFASSSTDTHTGTQLQVAEDEDTTFAAPIIDTLSSVMKTTIHIGTGELTAGEDYIARIRYHGAKYGWSAWSSVNGFTTAS